MKKKTQKELINMASGVYINISKSQKIGKKKRDRKSRLIERLEPKPSIVPFSKELQNECRRNGTEIIQ